MGQPLPEPGHAVRGIAADPAATTLVVATHRGMYRSDDGGRSWAFQEANLPTTSRPAPWSATRAMPARSTRSSR